MPESYDYYECAVCKKIKPAGSEVIRKIAYNKFNVQAQQEVRLSVYYAQICPACVEEHEGTNDTKGKKEVS